MFCLDTATAARAMAVLVGDPPSDRVEPLALNATLAIAIIYNAPWAHGQAICWWDKIVSDSKCCARFVRCTGTYIISNCTGGESQFIRSHFGSKSKSTAACACPVVKAPLQWPDELMCPLALKALI